MLHIIQFRVCRIQLEIFVLNIDNLIQRLQESFII